MSKLEKECEKVSGKKKAVFRKFKGQLLGGLRKEAKKSNSTRTEDEKEDEKRFYSDHKIPLYMSFPRAAADRAASLGHRCGLRDQTTSQLVEAMNGANKHTTNAISAARRCRSGRQTQPVLVVGPTKSGLVLILPTRRGNGTVRQFLVFGKKTQLPGGNCNWTQQENSS